MPAKIFDRALVVRGGALGDFLLTLPAIKTLRAASAHLALLAYPQFAGLAREAGLVDTVRSIEYGPLSGFFARGAVHDPDLRDYFSSFDVVVSYLYDPDDIFAENLREAGVKRLVTGVHKPDAGIHAVEQLAGPLAALGLSLGERAAELRMPGVSPHPSLIAMHPGSGSSAKNWPAERWETLARQLLAGSPSVRLAVVGGEADAAALRTLEGLRREDRVVFWDNLPLSSLARNLAGTQGYLGHDSGVSHLAAVLGVPSLLLFGPTDPAVWSPPHGHVKILRTEEDLPHLSEAAVLAAARQHLLPRLLA